MGIGYPAWTGGVSQFVADTRAARPDSSLAAEDLAAKYGERFHPAGVAEGLVTQLHPPHPRPAPPAGVPLRSGHPGFEPRTQTVAHTAGKTTDGTPSLGLDSE